MNLLIDADYIVYKCCAACETEIDYGEDVIFVTSNYSDAYKAVTRDISNITKQFGDFATPILFFSDSNNFRKKILPQTLRSMYPSLCSQFIFVFLTTGVISEIGVVDLTHSGLYIDSRTFRSFEVFIVLTVLYVLITLLFRAVLHLIFSKKLNLGN